MNLRFIKYLTFGLLFLTFISCTEKELVSPDKDKPDISPYSICISVESSSAIKTRTDVVDPDKDLRGLQHVTRVQLYIFEECEDNDFQLVASEDINWDHLEDAMKPGLPTKDKNYTTFFQGYLPDKKYMFLALGFDDTFKTQDGNIEFEGKNSVEAFGQPSEIIPIHSKFSTSNFFKLKDDVAVSTLNHSEFFAGRNIYTIEDLKDQKSLEKPIQLYRRVAGVAGYFKKCPTTINETEVKSVVLRTWTKQYTQTYFLPTYPEGKENLYTYPIDVPDEEYADYKESSRDNDTDSDIISRYELKDEEEGMITLSAYMLPMKASESKGKSTLSLDFLDEDGNILASRLIMYAPSTKSSTRSGTGIIDGPQDENKALYYPIRANQFYKMGSPESPIDLSGSTAYIFIEIDDIWDEYYGGSMDNDKEVPGLGLDKEWGQHEGGAINMSNNEI